jgi:hypothetical protein
MKLLILVLIAPDLGSCTMSSQAPPVVARFEIASDGDGGVWRVDTQTGEMEHCRLGGDSQIHCWNVFAPQSSN